MQIGSNAWMSLGIILLIGLAQPAGATSAMYWTEEEQARHSTAVVLAQVHEHTPMEVAAHQRPMQQTRILVDEVLYGDAPEQVHILQIGGSRDGISTTLPGDGKLNKGEHLLLFLYEDKGDWYLTALSQSVYRLVQSNGGTLLERELNLDLYQRNTEGRLEPIKPVQKKKRTLQDMRQRLKALAREAG